LTEYKIYELIHKCLEEEQNTKDLNYLEETGETQNKKKKKKNKNTLPEVEIEKIIQGDIVVRKLVEDDEEEKSGKKKAMRQRKNRKKNKKAAPIEPLEPVEPLEPTSSQPAEDPSSKDLEILE
jgi:hypothetical protein